MDDYTLPALISGILIGVIITLTAISFDSISKEGLCRSTSITLTEYETCILLNEDELFKQLPKIKYKEKGEK